MSDCENFKSPRELGLRICTSDIFCYDGADFECLVVPSDPTLNDILAAIDTQVCNLLELINNPVAPVVPNDVWKTLNLGDLVAFNFTGIVGSGTTVGFDYKIIAVDSALVRCRVKFSGNITSLFDFVNFNFTLPSFTVSNFFTVAKQFTMITADGGDLTHSPISIVITDGTGLEYVSKGRATVTNNLVFTGFSQPNIVNGNYDFEIDFQLMCRIIDA